MDDNKENKKIIKEELNARPYQVSLFSLTHNLKFLINILKSAQVS